jgi:cytochrome c oxidase subunit I
MWYSKNHLALEEELVEPKYAKLNRSSGFQPASSPNAHKPADPTFLTRCALGLAIGSLILAGCFALFLVVGRLPVVSELFRDPGFFKRCLVVHVDLSLVVWFFAFGAGLFALLPGNRQSNRIFFAGFLLALAGTIAMVAGMFVPGTEPVLSNYVPVIDHPLFISGIVLFFGGLLICFLDGRMFAGADLVGQTRFADFSNGGRFLLPPEVAVGLKAMALAYVVAISVFMISWTVTPRWMDAKAYYEVVFWGGGHVLQAANVATMLSVWLLMLSSLLGRPIVSRGAAMALFGLLVAPHFFAPLLTLEGTTSSLYRIGFTRMMQFGIFPVVILFLVICLRQLHLGWREKRIGKEVWRDARFIGFVTSVMLTLAGFIIGAMIRSSTTLIPAHYHASIGAVTVSLMAVTYFLVKPLGLPSPGIRLRRLIPVQLYMFGIGQLIFAIGFGWGGLHGLGRKAYGAEQHIRSLGEYAGLGIMAAGGVIAIAGGLMFLLIVVCSGRPHLSTIFAQLKLKLPARSNA